MNQKMTFEEFSYENGIKYWLASEYLVLLGYSDMQSFTKPLQKSMQTCLTLRIDPYENFIRVENSIDGKVVIDYKLTRFACYLIAMNGSPKIKNVARAQAYFARQAEQINLLLEGRNDIDRLLTREEIKEGNKALSSAAQKAGVSNYALFQDAGYRGLYNRGLKELKTIKGVEQSHDLQDYMGRAELAANLFRITMTEEKLKNNPSINTEKLAVETHKKVGSDVRKMVKENTGVFPEELNTERRLNDVSKELKRAKKLLNKKTDE